MTESSSFSFRSADDLLILCREMLGHPPTQESWLSVCHAIEACRSTLRSSSELQVAIDYLQGHVGHWKASQRRPLYRWWEKHQEGELDPVWALVGEPKMWLWDAGKQAGEVRQYPFLPGANVVWCPPGSFMMGASDSDVYANGDERPGHEACVSKGFWMNQTPITRIQFHTFMEGGTSDFIHPEWPISGVSWYEAAAFANALSTEEGCEPAYIEEDSVFYPREDEMYCDSASWRLPTEVEWEYSCCSGGTEVALDSIEELNAIGDALFWHRANSHTSPQPVGQKRPTLWGLYDMLGNVWEWVHDEFSGYSLTDRTGDIPGDTCVIRGGGWFCTIEEVRRTARRRSYKFDNKRDNLGFRLVVRTL